ncbi:MAG TPA: histidinol-phosphatase [Bacteroidales bacterium]|nr:histidinol-phosphatase [Bacteroidales bacterium]
MFPSNLHSHTNYSDGTHAPEDYLEPAIAAGLMVYGFSDHAPLSFEHFNWCIRPGKAGDYCDEIRRLKEKWGQRIQIYLGFEADFIPGISDASMVNKYEPDYVISSIHFLKKNNCDDIMEIDGSYEGFQKGFHRLFNNNAAELVKHYFDTLHQMVSRGGYDITGHADKIKMFLNRRYPGIIEETWYADQEHEAALMLASSGIVTEINTRSLYKKHGTEPYPSWEMIKTIHQHGGKLTLSADTHDPNGVTAFFDVVADELVKHGIYQLQQYDCGNFRSFSLTE